MSEPSTAPVTGAVFLSYARDDAAVARRIAEALRASGLEVWFDESELRGGDTWDAKIRRQIKECVLFLPVVSAHTQARGEGYFRLEWKLAVERTHLMAEGVPFLAPVVIDETKEAAAVVPTEFMRVQWTHLPGALPTPQFVEQVKRLLSKQLGAGSQEPGRKAGHSDTTLPKRSGLSGWALAALAVMVLGIAFLAMRKTEPAVAPVVTEAKLVAPATPVISDKSIAVIPFENRSDEKANAYFTDGIHDDILTSLANLRELRVISRTSVMEYRGTTKKVPQIARELGVAFILEGSVQRSGNTVRITGQLIRAATDEHVWAKNYDRELTATNLFAIQSELAQAIAAELKAALSPQEKTQLERAPTANLEAYDLYSKGREIFNARGSDIAGMFKDATPLYERAVQLDPKFAEAWAGLAAAYSLAYNRGIIERPPAAQAKALDAIQTALRLAPDNPQIILTLASYYTLVEGDHERALAECERAARISPNSVYYTLSTIYSRQGRLAETVMAARKAHELNPRSMAAARQLSLYLITGRRYAEAEEVLRQGIAVQPDSLEFGAMLASIPFRTRGSTREWDAWLAGIPPSSRTDGAFQTIHLQVTAMMGSAAEYVELVDRYGREASAGYGYALALLIKGEAERARRAAIKLRDDQLAMLSREPNNTAALGRLSVAYVVLGEKTAALEAADKSVSGVAASTSGVDPIAAKLRRAQILAWIGRKDEALVELNRLWWQPAIPRDALTSFMWAPLHGDPRFEAIKNDPRNSQPLF